MRRPWIIAAAIAIATLVSAGCTGGASPVAAPSADELVIASFDFPESELLMELYGQALEADGITVHRETALGPREFVDPALERGLVDLVPEYAGSALAFVTLDEDAPTADEAQTHAALATAFTGRGVTVLAASPAQDRNGIAVTKETATALHLQRISDLAPYAADMAFGGPPECQDRPFCLPGLDRVYGLRFGSFVALDAGGPLTLQALRTDTVDVALVFTSDGAVDRAGLTLLEDDRGLQPVENVTPVVRTAALDRFGGGLEAALNEVSAALSTEDLRRMNASVAIDGHAPATVASDWLHDHNLDG
jgi:osmoprotectant transport system substrate-binding protein